MVAHLSCIHVLHVDSFLRSKSQYPSDIFLVIIVWWIMQWVFWPYFQSWCLIGWSLLESDGFWSHEALGFASGISLSMNDISFSFLISEFQKKPVLLFFCCKQYSFFLHPLSKHLSQSIVSTVSPCCKLGYISSSEASERTALHVKVNSIVLGFLVIG